MIKTGKVFEEKDYVNGKSSDEQPTNFNIRVKRNSDDETLEAATAKGNYAYWLTQEDIADIARLRYDNYKRIGVSSEFEVLGSIAQLNARIDEFKLKTQHLAVARLTLIINLSNLHWVTLMISCQNGNYVGYYVDSKDNPISDASYHLLSDQFQIQPISLRTGFPQQTDEYNCGLLALENAACLNEMLDGNQPLHQVISELKQPRNREYFERTRWYLSTKLRVDVERNMRWSYRMGSVQSRHLVSDSEPIPKRQHVAQTKEEKAAMLLEKFVGAFMGAFMKRLAAYHLAAKGERLTDAALKVELKTGLTGGLLGFSISQSIVGSIPSLVASLRILSAKYYFPKAAAQKITRVFSTVLPGELSPILAEAAVGIFRSFESQFVQITDKAGDKVAMEKVAEDAVGRVLNYLTRDWDNPRVSKELIKKGLLLGPSEKFFDPSFKRVRIRAAGSTVQDNSGNSINTANLYNRVGVVSTVGDIKKFYKATDRPQSNQYGYRRLFSWEKEGNGELKQAIRDHYIEEQSTEQETVFQLSSRSYEYSLEVGTQHQEAQAILTKIESRGSKEPNSRIRQAVKKDSVFFDLRKPVANFVGRTEVLYALHQTLLAGRTTAVTTSLSGLSLHSISGASFPQSGSQTSVSGLGGIGKTQLVLRYAQLHAADYDNNVLWINAETKENLVYSLNALATKLQLETKDSYSHEKTPEEIAEAIYDYFSDRKSLFIFDNVENYREIEAYLPKSIPGNKPSILMTSRYSHWQNVASIIALGVFTEAEFMGLVKKELNLMDNTQDAKIKELAILLQGLPLALQQALAYINLQRNVNTGFSIQNYIELYKEKTKQLLGFDFASYTHDPYAKTVLTTWQITLDKIQADQTVGKNALEILNVMAYLCPDNISNMLFLKMGSIELSSALHLLKSYSMISPGSQQDKSSIHRLVQQVVRINLEGDLNKLREVMRQTEKLIIDYEGNVENRFHYLHFLLYMTEYAELKSILQISHTSRELFRILPHHDTKYWLYFLDLAYSKFSKERYIKFLGEALIYYSRSPSPLFLSETLYYIEKKWSEGVLSKENIKYILERRYYPDNPYHKLLTYFPNTSQKREQQRVAIELIYSLKEKLFKGDKEYSLCLAQPLRKRSVNSCRLSETESRRAEESARREIKTHLRNVVRLSDWASSGLLTKDILSALVQGEFGTAAIDFSLIGSSILLGNISNKLLTQGSLLVDNTRVFTKDLALENERALKIILDKDVLLAAKSRFLGQAMKTASPFVARGTVILFAYNLINEIEEYAKGNKLILPEIISNGVIVGIEGIEAGIEALEFLGFIAGVSEFTGPIGTGAVALVWFGAEAYHAKKQLEVIETQVHLTLIEKLKQSLRAFFHLLPSEYLEVKAANNQLLENALAFLKNHTEIKSYIFPAFSTPTTLFDKSEVFLEKKRKLIVSDSMPDAPLEGNLFCLSGDISDSITHWFESESATYLCKNAIGLEYSVNRTGNITFVNLKQGDDEMLASPGLSTLYLVEAGKKKYRGGDDTENLFILQGDSITGLLQGGNGTDTLLLNDFDPKADYVLHDSRGFLCGKNNGDDFNTQLYCPTDMALELKDIEKIYGRKDEKDILYVSQYTDFIDGYGGKDKAFPDYFYITPYSHRNPKLVLRNNSVVLVLLNTRVNSVSYRIAAVGGGEAKVQFSFTEAIQHQFFFDFALTDIRTITTDNATIRFELASQTATHSSQETFSLAISNPYFNLSGKQVKNVEVPAQAYYFFQGLEVKLLNQDHIYAREYENKDRRTIDERINSFVKLAKHLGKSFFIQLMDYKSIFIGQKKHEVFYTNSDTENYLVGNVIGNTTDNEDENIYVVSATNAAFPLPKLVIYDSMQENLEAFEILSDTLDLRKVIERAEQFWPGGIVSFRISQIGNDLTLALFFNTDIFLANIILKNALLDNWYQKLSIILDTNPRSIIRADNGIWQLETVPLTFDSDKEIIMLNQQNIDNNTEVFVLKKIGNYLFLRDKNNLIITNLFSNPYDRCTIICKKFYDSQAMREKLLAATFIFLDQSLQLQRHLTEINNATNFSELSQRNITGLPLGWLDVASNHSAKRRSIRNALPKFQAKQPVEQMTSSATMPLAPGLLSWIKEKGIALGSTIRNFYAEFFTEKGCFLSKKSDNLYEKENLNSNQPSIYQETNKQLFLSDVYPELIFQKKNNSTFNQSLLTNVTVQFELNGTLMLSHLIAQNFFNKKVANTQKLSKKTDVKSKLFKP